VSSVHVEFQWDASTTPAAHYCRLWDDKHEIYIKNPSSEEVISKIAEIEAFGWERVDSE